MPQPSLQNFTDRALAAVIQSAEGTPAEPSVMTNGVRIYDGRSFTEFDPVEDNIDRPFFTGKPFAVANKRGGIEGQIRLYPPAVPGHASDGIPDCDVMLRPGGMTRVLDAVNHITRYNPISTNMPVLTAWFWHATQLLKVWDARNQISGLRMEIGQRFQMQVRSLGTYETLDKEALPEVTLSDEDGPVIEAENSFAEITVLQGVDPEPLEVKAKSLGVDFNSDLKSISFTNLKVNDIAGRPSTWNMRIAQTDLDDFNPVAIRDAAASGPPVFILATMRVRRLDGRYSLLGIRGQIRDVADADADGKKAWDLSGPCVASSAGGDEFWAEFGEKSLALSGTLDGGTEGVPYSGTTALTAGGAYVGPLVWSISTGTLPDGLAIDDETGEISGTPTTAGSSTFTVQAVSADGQTATSAQTVVIAAP